MTRRISSFFTAAALIFSMIGTLPASFCQAEASEKTRTPLPEKGTYQEGQVLVTIASPRKTPLTKEGTVSFDKELTVEDSWDFGGADVLAGNAREKEFLEDKSLYVTKVSSDTYSF